MSRSTILSLVLVASVLGIPFAYKAFYSVKYRNLRVVQEGILYRSGQMTPEGFAKTMHELGIQTVISLRDTKDESGSHDDENEEIWCRDHNKRFERFQLADWTEVKGKIPGEENVFRFLNLMEDPTVKKPVLVHCFAGIHRTGANVAVYRMEKQGWTNHEAYEEIKSVGTVRTTFAPNFTTYIMNYRLRKSR